MMTLTSNKVTETRPLKKPSFCFIQRRRPDLNRRIKVLQTSALPLGYVAWTIIYFTIFLFKVKSRGQ